MKKFFLAFMAVATIAMVGCKKDGGNTPITPTPGDSTQVDPGQDVDLPEIDAPAEGHVTFVINIPKNSECNGIAFKGTIDGTSWTGADQYLDDYGPADVEDCIRFEAIEGYDNWYVATYTLGDEPWGEGTLLAGKICLIYTNDGSWEGQFVNWTVNDEYSTADNGRSGDGNIEIYGGGLVYVTIGGWQGSECATPQDYNITVIVPEFCDEPFDIELIGSFCGWADDKTVALVAGANNTYTATITATENAEWKVRGVGGWDKEIQIYDAESEDEPWKGVPNNVLGKDLNVTVDYSDAETYRWNVCAEEE